MRYSSITAIGAFTALTTASADCLLLDPSRCSGGGGASLRTTEEDAPGADGILWFPALDGAQIITLGGLLRITSSATESGYISAIGTLEASIQSALATIKTTPGTFTYSAGSLSVALHSPYDSTWENGQKWCLFGLVVVT